MPIAFTALLYLVEAVRSVQPSATEIRSQAAPRSFLPWSHQERQLVTALTEAGFDEATVAKLIQRTETAVQRHRQEYPRGVDVSRLPQSSQLLSQRDLGLLEEWVRGFQFRGEKDDTPPRAYPRDPLGWQYGQPLPLSLDVSEPTLQIFWAQRDEHLSTLSVDDSLYWPDLAIEYEQAAHSLWLDMAASVIQAGGVILHGLDAAGQTALRKSLQRVNGTVPPRGSVRSVLRIEGARHEVALLGMDLLWSQTSLPDLQQFKLLLAVLPDWPSTLPDSEEENLLSRFPTPSWASRVDIPFLMQANADKHFWSAVFKRRRELEHSRLVGVKQNRQLSEQLVSGSCNSHELLARLDWLSLAYLPDGGTVYAADWVFILRACCWHALAVRRRGTLSPAVREQAKRVWQRLSDPNVSADAQAASSIEDRVSMRCLTDLTDFPIGPVADITFDFNPQMRVTYIGY